MSSKSVLTGAQEILKILEILQISHNLQLPKTWYGRKTLFQQRSYSSVKHLENDERWDFWIQNRKERWLRKAGWHQKSFRLSRGEFLRNEECVMSVVNSGIPRLEVTDPTVLSIKELISWGSQLYVTNPYV